VVVVDGSAPVVSVVVAAGAEAAVEVDGVVVAVALRAEGPLAGGDMNIKRMLRHLIVPTWYTRRVFPQAALQTITDQIKLCESTHGGEIRVAIEAELSANALLKDQSPRDRAMEVFASLRIWDTDNRNGVLIYLCLADRAIEIVADRGLNGKITSEEWQRIANGLQTLCAQEQYQLALCSAIQDASVLLAKYFPSVDRNELPDSPVLL